MSPEIPVYVMLGLGLAGIVSIIVWLGFLTQNKDNGAEIQRNLAIVSAVVAVLVFLFGGAAYIYFMSNTVYLLPFLLIMSFINMALSVIAVSTASLGVVNI